MSFIEYIEYLARTRTPESVARGWSYAQEFWFNTSVWLFNAVYGNIYDYLGDRADAFLARLLDLI